MDQKDNKQDDQQSNNKNQSDDKPQFSHEKTMNV